MTIGALWPMWDHLPWSFGFLYRACAPQESFRIHVVMALELTVNFSSISFDNHRIHSENSRLVSQKQKKRGSISRVFLGFLGGGGKRDHILLFLLFSFLGWVCCSYFRSGKYGQHNRDHNSNDLWFLIYFFYTFITDHSIHSDYSDTRINSIQ